MKKSDTLRQERADILDKMDALSKEAKGRAFSEEERSSWNEWKAKAESLATDIQETEEREAVEAERAELEAKRRADQRRTIERKTPEEKVSGEFRLLRAINLTLQGKPLDGAEKEMNEEGHRQFQNSGVSPAGNLQLPRFIFQPTVHKRDMLSETTTAGGFTVATEIGDVIPFLANKMVVRDLGATVLTGLTGNIDFPRNDALAAAVWEGEADANAETSPTFDRVQMSPERLGAFTDISKQVLLQSSIDMDRFVRDRLAQAIALELDETAINGSGTGDEPAGILNTGSIGDVSHGANGGASTWATVVEHLTDIEVANSDFGNLAWLTTPQVKGKLLQIERATNTAQFLLNEPGNSLLGYRFEISNQVPSNLTKGTGTSLHAMIFGNWQELIIGQWGGVDLVVDPYSGAKNALVTLVINTWWDIALRHAASFTASVDIDVS